MINDRKQLTVQFGLINDGDERIQRPRIEVQQDPQFDPQWSGKEKKKERKTRFLKQLFSIH